MELRYDIVATGEQNIRRALRGVEAELVTSSRRASSVAARSAGGSNSSKKAEREAAAAQRKAVSDQAKATRTAERERIASEKRVERERIASERAVGREQQKQQDYWAKARQRAREADRRSADSAAIRAARGRESSVRSFSRGVGSSVRSATGTIAGLGGMALGAVGAVGAAEAVSQEIDIDRRVRQAVVNARGPGEAGTSPESLRNTIRGTALSTGTSESGLVGAVETYTARTGDLKTATDNLQTFATVAMATGASVEDVAATAADLSQKFNITKPKEMADAFAVLAFQGKKGAFELRDMASTFPEMAAAAQRAGMTGVGGMKTLGGLAQLARQSTGSGAEASTALQMALTQLIASAGDLKSGKALGGKKVNVFEGGDATKNVRDIRQVLAETISKSRGNLTQLGALFDVRGIRAVSPLVSAYRSASAAAGGGKKGEEAGKAAVLKTIADASDSAGKFSDVMVDASAVAESESVKLEKINTRLRDAFSSKLIPALDRMLPKFEEMIPRIATATEKLAAFATWFSDNPIKGLGALVLGKVALDLAGAGIGKGVESALVALVGRIGAGSATASTAASVLTPGATSAAGGGILARMAGAIGVGGALSYGAAVASGLFVDSKAEDLRKTVGGTQRSMLGAGAVLDENNNFSWQRALTTLASPIIPGVGADQMGSSIGNTAYNAYKYVTEPIAAPTTQGQELAPAAAELKAAAVALKEAAAKQGSAAGDPSRTKPIVARN